MRFEESRDQKKVRLTMPLSEFEKNDMIEGGKLVGGRHWLGASGSERLYFPDHYQSDIGPIFGVRIVNLYINLQEMDLVIEYKERKKRETQNKEFAQAIFKAVLQLFQRDFQS